MAAGEGANRRSGSRGSVAASFLTDLVRTRESMRITDMEGKEFTLEEALGKVIDMAEETSRSGRKIIFVGNGGSAAIASHMAIDYWKNGGIDAIAFNDASLLTCISNDFGYERVFAEPIHRFSRPGDMLVAISSSGKSPNILNGVAAARSRGCRTLTLSGFEETNPLRSLGEINFYVPSRSYGIVEISHESLMHSVLEEIILKPLPDGEPA